MSENTKITRFGYIINKKTLDDDSLSQIKEDLTVKPLRYGNFGKYENNTKFPLYVENGDYINIPKYYGLEKFGEPDINQLEIYKYPTYNMKYIVKLRPTSKKYRR